MDVRSCHLVPTSVWMTDLPGSLPQTASAFWSVLVAPKYPLMKDVLEFINVRPLRARVRRLTDDR